MKAVDLGCGDFYVGSRICNLYEHYTAIDIVSEVIDSLKGRDEFKGVEFQCVDAISEELPEGDVVFVRQVFQHLSNNQINGILKKLRKYKHVVITEHIPVEEDLVTPNVDKPHGGSIRLNKGSGIYLELPPFDFKYSKKEVLLEVFADEKSKEEGVIVTTAYEL